MLYKNMKEMVHSFDGDRDSVTVFLQGGTLASYLFILYLDFKLLLI